MRSKLVLLLLAITLITAYAIAQDVPANLQAKLMLKILSMDRNFNRFGDPVKIGTSSDEFAKELNAMPGLKVKGKSFKAEKMNSLDDIDKYRVIYVGKNWASNYSAIESKAVASKTLVFCETEDGVLSGGGSVSFKVVEGKPKIVVNLENAKKQGTDFPADFLKITVVVGSI
jgi:hypothetical protein